MRAIRDLGEYIYKRDNLSELEAFIHPLDAYAVFLVTLQEDNSSYKYVGINDEMYRENEYIK